MKEAIKEFANYTNNYLDIGHDSKKKTDHSLRVMKLCEKIAKSLNLNEEEVFIATLCGVVHDIGRFEQLRRFNSFSDSNIDHGDLGEEILKKNNYIKKYIQDDKYKSIVLNSVKNHNKLVVDDSLTDYEKMFCNIVRDADKIDILALNIIGEVGGVEIKEKFSDDVYNNLINKKTISKKDKKTKGDSKAVILGFAFDINYKYSYEYLYEKGYFNKSIDVCIENSKNIEFTKQLEEIRKVINNYIEVKLC